MAKKTKRKKVTSKGVMKRCEDNALKSTMQAKRFLEKHSDAELMELVGKRIKGIDPVKRIDKAVLPVSFGGGKIGATDDLLAGKGLFYITEKGKMVLDCTAGHYQMTWGYNNPKLNKAVLKGMASGIVPDNHSNIPQWPVKRLAQKLVEIANPDCPELARGDFTKIMKSKTRLNTVLVGIVTGSVACSSALKIMLMQHQKLNKPGPAVLVVLDGNYHGTDMIAQSMRGMWKEYVRNIKVVAVQPNDRGQLKKVFAEYGERIAGFWAEPIMMNREAILIEKSYLKLARRLTKKVNALMAIDEIQTGFWVPEIFMIKQADVRPDMIIIGKGMTAGFHPLSALIYRRELDMMAQYDSISTNGNAALASYAAMTNIEMIEQKSDKVGAVNDYFFKKMERLADDFSDRIAFVNGKGLMTGLKFHSREDAISFHEKCVDSGLWLRAHAYHEGHSTILCKFALCVNKKLIDGFCKRLRNLLELTKS